MLLPIQHHQIQSLPGGWQQLTLICSMPVTIEVGARITAAGLVWAVWRRQENQVDCLALGTPEGTTDLTAFLTHQGDALPVPDMNRPLLILGEGLGVADALFAAGHLKSIANHCLVLLSADNFPCQIKPARFMVEVLPDLIAACPLLEDWGFANRLCTRSSLPGCFDGDLDTCLQHYPMLPSAQTWHFV